MSPTFTTAAVNPCNVLRTGPGVRAECIGNLAQNGGFEHGLSFWRAANVKTVTGKETHEGLGAAGLGAYHQNHRKAVLRQDVSIPQGAKNQFYQVILHVAGYKDHPASLTTTLTWLDARQNPLGLATQAHIHRRAIGNGSRGKWSTYMLITNMAPLEAGFARLEFVKRPGPKRWNYLIIDDVVITGVMPVCFRRNR